ncbi:MAG: hypothetical protein GMKNLPBB_00025 [Myxococcota bacterium]|nr:hypothetical protein [Myxococcota bacterium]
MNRTAILNFLEGAFKIRPNEAARVGLLFLYSMNVIGGGFVVGRIINKALFLGSLPKDKIPFQYLGMAVGVSLVSLFYTKVANKLRRDRMNMITLALVVLGLLGFRIALYSASLKQDFGFLFSLYIYFEVLSTILVIQFFNFITDIFDSRQTKRLMGVITSGGVMSNVFAGALIANLVQHMATEDLIYVMMGNFLACMVCVWMVGRESRQQLTAAFASQQGVQKGTPRNHGGFIQDIRDVFASKHLTYIALIVVVTGVVTTIADQQFSEMLKSRFENCKEENTRFLGSFYMYMGIVAWLLQMFVTNRLLERLNVVFAMLVLPVVMSLGSLGVLFGILIFHNLDRSIYFSSIFMKAGDNTFRYTINDSTIEQLYTPVRSALRTRAKALISGVVKPLTIGLLGLFFIFMNRALDNLEKSRAAESGVVAAAKPGGCKEVRERLNNPSAPMLVNPSAERGEIYAGISLLMIMLWTAFVLKARKLYKEELDKSLRSRRLNLEEGAFDIHDDSTIKVLTDNLGHPQPEKILNALDIIRHAPQVNWDEHVIRLLDHANAEVRARAAEHLGRTGKTDHADRVFKLTTDESPVVRAAAVQAFCAIGQARAISIIAPRLKDPDPIIKSAAVSGMIQHGGLDGVLAVAETLKQMLESPDKVVRLNAVQVLGRIRVKNFYQPVLKLLSDPSIEVQHAAIQAAGEMGAVELMPVLVYKLADSKTSRAAANALLTCGYSPILGKVISMPFEDPVIRIQMARVLARIGGLEAWNALHRNLDTGHDEVRINIYLALGRLLDRDPALKIDVAAVQRQLRAEVRDCYQTLAMQVDLGIQDDGGHSLLHDALQERHRRGLRRVMTLLGLIHGTRTMEKILINLSSRERSIRANAIELLDNQLEGDLKRMILPLVDAADPRRCMEQGEEFFQLRRFDPEGWLQQFINGQDPWLVTCAIHQAGEMNLTSLIDNIEAQVNSPHPIVRETAIFSLKKLLEPEELRVLLRERLEDAHPAVRAYARFLLPEVKE